MKYFSTRLISKTVYIHWTLQQINASFLRVIELRRSNAASQAIWPMTLRCTFISDRIIAEISLYTNIFITPYIDNCINSLDVATVNAGFFSCNLTPSYDAESQLRDMTHYSKVYAHFGENYHRNGVEIKRFQHDRHRKVSQFTGRCNFQCWFFPVISL